MASEPVQRGLVAANKIQYIKKTYQCSKHNAVNNLHVDWMADRTPNLSIYLDLLHKAALFSID